MVNLPRTASTYVDELIRANYAVDLTRVHDPKHLPSNSQISTRIQIDRLPHWKGAMSQLIFLMDKPDKIELEQWLQALSYRYNWHLDLSPTEHWYNTSILDFNLLIINPYYIQNKLDILLPRISDNWINVDPIISKKKYKEWITNHEELIKVAELIEQEGHYQGYQIIKDIKDPRFSNKRRPLVEFTAKY